jgi:integrase
MLLTMAEPSVLELLRATQPRTRYREQTGTVVKRSDGFYIRYYQDRDGVRTKVTERLCDLSTNARLIPSLQRSFISSVNIARHNTLQSRAEAPKAQPLTINDFWNDTYRPWVEANKRFSTLRGYDYDWKLYVKEHLAHRTFSEFTTVDACDLLDHCASVKKLSRRSLAHVKSLCSGIFSHAVRKGIIQFNPWREAKESVRVRESEPRIEYTPEETIAIINAVPEAQAKLFFALVAVMGMRPSEAAAVRWENIKDDVVHVLKAAPYGQLGDLKTKRSKRDLIITEPVTSLLKTYRKERSNPAEGLLFTHDGVKPINHNGFARAHIKPHAEKVCKRWNGCYSGRHGAATTLYNITGDVRAAYQVLGNSLAVVQKEYIKPSVEQGQAGQLQYAQVLRKVMRKARK